MKAAAVLFALLTSAGFAAPLLDEPLPELHLTSGKTLYDAQAKSYATKSVLVKHRDGAETVPYDQFPSEYRDALLKKRPQPKPADQQAQPAPSPTPKAAPKPTAQSSGNGRITLTSSSIGANFTSVDVTNDTPYAVQITPMAILAETSTGQVVRGRHWVQADASGNITGSLKAAQAMDPKSTISLNVVFEVLPAGISINRVFMMDGSRANASADATSRAMATRPNLGKLPPGAQPVAASM